MGMTASDRARLAIGLLDLTSLGDGDTGEAAADLCRRAVTPFGSVAAVCLWPRFVAQARRALDDTPVRVATVVNFPEGKDDPETVAAETRAAVADGAHEIDVVAPWRAFLAGDVGRAEAVLAACREACGDGVSMKVIHESGAFEDREPLAELARLALVAGADFLKTSTGKGGWIGATRQAVETFAEVIAEAGSTAGIKPSGGVRTAEQAETYMAVVERVLGPEWLAPARLRIGASALLDDLSRIALAG